MELLDGMYSGEGGVYGLGTYSSDMCPAPSSSPWVCSLRAFTAANTSLMVDLLILCLLIEGSGFGLALLGEGDLLGEGFLIGEGDLLGVGDLLGEGDFLGEGDLLSEGDLLDEGAFLVVALSLHRGVCCLW